LTPTDIIEQQTYTQENSIIIVVLKRRLAVKKRAFAIVVSIILLFSTQSYADSNNDISWNKAVMYQGWFNNKLLNMSENVRIAKREYEQAVDRAKDIETEGITTKIMGREFFIHFDDYTKMLMNLEKRLVPEQMKLSWEMSRDSWRTTRNAMVIGLRNCYLGLYSSDSENKISQRKYELAQMINNQDKIKHQRGLISDIELAASEYDFMKAKTEAEAAKRNYENMLRSFNAYIGMKPETVYGSVAYDEQYSSGRLKQCDDYVNAAKKNRLDIVGLEKQILLLSKKKAIMDEFPLSLNTVVARKDYNSTIADMELLTLKLESMYLNIEREIKEVYVEVSAADKNIVNMKKMLDLQKSSLEKTEKRYLLGLISKNIMDQAQIRYDEFESSYKSALFDYNTKLMRLEFEASIGLAF
jgi:uncharacterized protein (UPF0335 family)